MSESNRRAARWRESSGEPVFVPSASDPAGDRLCLVNIFQANLVGLMSPPKLAFYMVCSVYLISTSTSPLPQKFVEGRTLTWDLRN